MQLNVTDHSQRLRQSSKWKFVQRQQNALLKLCILVTGSAKLVVSA